MRWWPQEQGQDSGVLEQEGRESTTGTRGCPAGFLAQAPNTTVQLVTCCRDRPSAQAEGHGVRPGRPGTQPAGTQHVAKVVGWG